MNEMEEHQEIMELLFHEFKERFPKADFEDFKANEALKLYNEFADYGIDIDAALAKFLIDLPRPHLFVIKALQDKIKRGGSGTSLTMEEIIQ